MKTTAHPRYRLHVPLLLCSLLASAAGAFAQTSTWNGSAGSTGATGWANNANWTPNASPSGNALIFPAGISGGALTSGNDIEASLPLAPAGGASAITFSPGAGAYVLGGLSVATGGGFVDNASGVTETIDFGITLTGSSHSLNATAGGELLVNGSIGDGGLGYGITANGQGTVSLTTNETYAGTTSVTAGTLELDFNTLANNTAGALQQSNNIVSASSALSLGGGTLDMNGSSTLTNSQTFSATTFSGGSGVINVAPASGTVTISNNLALGALTYDVGSTVMFVGPPTSSGATTTAGQSGAYGNGTGPAGMSNGTANITTTSGTVNQELTGSSTGVTAGSSTAGEAAFATVGLYDYAVVIGTSPYTIIGASQSSVPVTYTDAGTGVSTGTDGGYVLMSAGQFGGGSGGSGGPFDVVTSGAVRNTDNVTAIRFNALGAATLTGGSTLSTSGILVTPNVGPNNVHESGAISIGVRGSPASSMVIWQNNTNGLLVMNGPINDSRTGGGALVQAGAGTVVYTGAGAYAGPTYLNGGVSEIFADSAIGTAATAALLNLNGGTVLCGGTIALDNAGANPRPINLGINGGGLAAVAGGQLTVDGLVTNTGTLYIGIPATSANGFVAGLLPGTGGTTANTTPTNATGTVVLTGANTYTGGTVLDSGTLIFSTTSLGTGGIVFNGGALQWASGTTLDISSQNVTIAAGGGTVILGGNTVTLANSIGNLGSGQLTVTNGTLTLAGSNTYTGGTLVNGAGATLLADNTAGSATGSGPVTVTNLGTLGGTGTIAGNVTWQSGALALFTVGSPLTVSGSVTLNGNAVTVNVPGSTPLGIGTNTLMNYLNAGSSGSFVTSLAPGAFTGAGLAPGTIASLSTGGGKVQVMVVSSGGVVADWNAGANGNWSVGADWSGGQVPGTSGASATFGVGNPSALTIVSLNQNETAGELSFTNANSFEIANDGGFTLALNNNSAPPVINVLGGAANSIQTALTVTNAVNVTVQAGDALSITSPVANANNNSPGTFVVSAAGTFALSGNNSYGPSESGTSGTSFSGGGILQVGSSGALGMGDLDIVNLGNDTLQAAGSFALSNNIDIASGATLIVDSQANSVSLYGTIEDSGALTKIGSGTLTLVGANSYSGTTTIDAGTVSISADDNFGGSAEAPVVLNGGDLLGGPGAGLTRNVKIGPTSVSAPGTNALIDAAAGGTFTLAGTLGTAGNSGVNNLLVNTRGGSGTVELEGAGSFGGTTVISNGTLMVGIASALQNSTLVYSNAGGNLAFDGNQSVTTATFGALTGSQSLALTNTAGGAVNLTLGGNNSSTTYSGILSDGGAGSGASANLIKVGSGTFILSGANTYSGSTSDNAGTLIVTNGGAINGTSLLGAGFVVAGGTVTLSGTTALSDVNTDFLETSGTVNAHAFNPQGNADGGLIAITGGYFSATSMDLQRSVANTVAPTATVPQPAVTTAGLYIRSTNTSAPAVVNLGSLTFGDANSSGSARMDSGTLTITNEIECGAIIDGSTRWSILQINGGTFTNLDTVNGIVLSQNGAGATDNAEVYLSGGNSYVGVINFGLASDTVGGQGFLIVTNAGLYMGGGGINLLNTTGSYTETISLLGGTLGATTNWTTGLPFLLDGTSMTIQAGDPSGNSWNITNSGGISGAGNLVKTGGGILSAAGANAWSGTTTVSNGTLALVGDGLSTGFLSQTPSITVVHPGAVDPSGLTFDGALHVGDPYLGQSAQTLAGNGSVNNSVYIGGTGTLTPGPATGYGTLTISNNLTVTNGGTVVIAIDHPVTGATSDSVTASSLNITNTLGGSPTTLTITQGTNDLDTGDVFHLFNIAGNNGVSSTTNFTINLPTTAPVSGITYVWNTNNLAVNGTLNLVTGDSAINQTPTNLMFSLSGKNLTIGWPANQTGWRLLVQSNSLATGLLTNSANWVTVPGSTNVNQEIIQIGATNEVFFELVYP